MTWNQWEPTAEKQAPYLSRCSTNWLNICILISREAGLVGVFLQYLRGVKKTPHVMFNREKFEEVLAPQRIGRNVLKRGLDQLAELGLIVVSKHPTKKTVWCVEILDVQEMKRIYPWNAIKTRKLE